MKKKILMGCLLCMMAVSMVACANESESMEEETRKERERDSDSDEGSALLGQLASLIGDEVPLAASVTETKTETVTEEEVVEYAEEEVEVKEDTVELKRTATDSDIFNLKIEEPVFYNENGVTLTYEGFVEEDSDVKLKIKIDNNNTENKKVYVQIHQIAINNILANESGVEYTYMEEEYYVLAGQSDIITPVPDQYNYYYGDVKEQYTMFYEWQQERIGIPDNKVQTVTIEYNVKIGSDGEGEERKAVLKTSNYVEGSLESYYGDYVTNVELETYMENYIQSNYEDYQGISVKDYNIEIDGKGIIEIYKKDTESGMVFVLKNTDDELVYSYSARMYVNGNDIEELNEAENSRAGLLIGNGGIDVYEFSATPEKIRAAFEIPNAVPLCYSMCFMNNRGQEIAIVPIMTIE